MARRVDFDAVNRKALPMWPTAKCVLSVLDNLHDLNIAVPIAAPESTEGKLLVVRQTGTSPVETQTPHGKTTIYQPIFEIMERVDRPDELMMANKASRPGQMLAPRICRSWQRSSQLTIRRFDRRRAVPNRGPNPQRG